MLSSGNSCYSLLFWIETYLVCVNVFYVIRNEIVRLQCHKSRMTECRIWNSLSGSASENVLVRQGSSKLISSLHQTNTVTSKSFGTKWKYILTISWNILILNNLCKQYESRSRPMTRGSWSSIHIVWYPTPLSAKNWLYFVGWLEFWR